MADVYGTQMAKANSVPMKMGDAHSMGGRMRILSDTYTVPASGALAGDIIVLGDLPKGARVWDCHLGVSGAVGTGPISVGTRVTDSSGTVTTDAVALLGTASHNANFNRQVFFVNKVYPTFNVSPLYIIINLRSIRHIQAG